MERKTISVALDGPGGAGKSTVAKAIAKKYGFTYVDTGAIYRTLGLFVRRAGADPHSPEAVEPLLPWINIEIRYSPDGQRMLLNGEDVTGLIRSPEISMYASAVSALPAVRAFLLDMQRSLAASTDVVMDGRDIGTVVLPGAEVKIFLTASIDERARRRYEELKEKGDAQSLEEVRADMLRRDKNDTERAVAPLKQADDAVLVDTTELGFDEAVEAVSKIIREKTGR
jgi:cytidylate kinase